jgi:hypothetical protein
MSGSSLARRAIACTMATVAVAGTMTLGAAGVAAAAPAARPNTRMVIGESHLTANKYEVFCQLFNASTNAGLNGDVVKLDRNGQPDHSANTSDGGLVTFTVTVNSGTTAFFQCLFLGNAQFVMSTTNVIPVP